MIPWLENLANSRYFNAWGMINICSGGGVCDTISDVSMATAAHTSSRTCDDIPNQVSFAHVPKESYGTQCSSQSQFQLMKEMKTCEVEHVMARRLWGHSLCEAFRSYL